MVEEALNFGMNATQLSNISNLKGNVIELNRSLRAMSKNLASVIGEQEVVKEKMNEELERQTREHERQQKILNLRNSIFKLKLEMENIYSSEDFTIEEKFVNFRNVSISQAVMVLNPNFFDTFDDKEYVVSVVKFLDSKKKELFENLSNDKKSIMQLIERKEKSFDDMCKNIVSKPEIPTEPIANYKLQDVLTPIKPNDYYDVPERIRESDANIERDLTENMILLVTLILFLIMLVERSIAIFIEFLVDIRVSERFEFTFMMILVFICGWYLYSKVYKRYKLREKMYKYDDRYKVYVAAKKHNKDVIDEFQERLQNFEENKEILMNTYLEEDNIYQNYIDRKEKLKQEINNLYESFMKK